MSPSPFMEGAFAGASSDTTAIVETLLHALAPDDALSVAEDIAHGEPIVVRLEIALISARHPGMLAPETDPAVLHRRLARLSGMIQDTQRDKAGQGRSTRPTRPTRGSWEH